MLKQNVLTYFRHCLVLAGASFVLTACGEVDIRDTVDMEYLEAGQAKPVVYPSGMDKPTESQAYGLPKVPSGPKTTVDNINNLVRPPSLLTAEQRGDIGSLSPEEAKKKLKEAEKEDRRKAKQAEAAEDESEEDL